MSTQVILTNAKIVLPDEIVHGSVQLIDGKISSVDQGMTSLPNSIDFDGDYLMPGMIEVHTDNFERHLMPRPKVYWSELPALLAHDAEIAAAGITTVFDALGVGEADTDSLRGSAWTNVVQAMQMCEDHQLLRAEHHLHARCELPAPNTIELFEPFHNHPRLSLISLMDHTPGQRQWEDIEQARVYFTGKKGWSHEKFEDKVRNAEKLQSEYAAPHRKYFVDYCKTHGIQLASHDDTTIEHVEQAHEEGASMSEFPTTLAAAQAANALGLLTVMGGPNVVRGGSHSGNVAASQLAKLKLLDILSSDYVPASLMGAVMRLVNDEILTLPEAVNTVTRAPAKATGLLDRGVVSPGKRGDLLRVKLANFAGRSRHAVVSAVWREGRQVI